MLQEFFKRLITAFADVYCISHLDDLEGLVGIFQQNRTDGRLKLQLSVDIEDLASNKQEELMVEGMMQCKTDGREEVI